MISIAGIGGRYLGRGWQSAESTYELKTPIDRTSLGDGLEILIDNEEIGICMLGDRQLRAIYMLNHLEYDNRSLVEEYERDLAAGLQPDLPVGLFPDNDPTAEPENRWRSHGHLLFQNWINEIYQTTPFALEEIGRHN